MRLLETAADCTEEEILRVAKTASPRTMRLTIRLVLLPFVAQISALLFVPDAVLAPGGWARAIVESATSYLPMIETLLLSGDAYVDLAFAHWVGLMAALVALMLATLFEPTFKSLIPSVLNGACTALSRGKAYRPARALLFGAILIPVLFGSGVLFTLGGNSRIHLGAEDLHRAEVMILFLLEMPLLHAMFGGISWGLLAALLRGWIALAANLQRVERILQTLDDHGLIEPINTFERCRRWDATRESATSIIRE
jgi:hypothetical protein